MYCFSTLYQAFLTFPILDFYNDPSFETFLHDPFYKFLEISEVFIVIVRTLEFALFTSSAVYLYRKAAGFDKSAIMTPNQMEMMNSLEEMKD
jgi:hypothetical protein